MKQTTAITKPKPKARPSKPKPRPVGRPDKLTPAVQTKILNAVRVGNFALTACAYAGIGKTTYYEWIKRAEADEVKRRKSKYREFKDALRAAEAEAEVFAVTQLRNLANQDTKAVVEFLRRRFRHGWGDKVQIEGPEGGKEGGPVVFQFSIQGASNFGKETV